jgi:hypothetical protein
MIKHGSAEPADLQIQYRHRSNVLSQLKSVKNVGMSGLLKMKQQPAPGGVDPATHHVLLAAIQAKRLLRFSLDGKSRTAEPHDYGIRNGAVWLLAYQIAGASSGPLPGWRWINVSRMSDAELLDKAFSGGRPCSEKHHSWEVLFARVDHS